MTAAPASTTGAAGPTRMPWYVWVLMGIGSFIGGFASGFVVDLIRDGVCR